MDTITSDRTFTPELVGTWQGTYELQFDPSSDVITSATRASVELEPGGRTLLLRYEWIFEDLPRHGIALFSRTDEGLLQMAWTDTFHHADGLMTCVAEEPDGTSVLGSYTAGGNTWGWRTAIELRDADTLVVTAWNVIPGEGEFLATRATYARDVS